MKTLLSLIFALTIFSATAQQTTQPTDTIPRDTVRVEIDPGTYQRLIQFDLERERLRGDLKELEAKFAGVNKAAEEAILTEIRLSPAAKGRNVVRYYLAGATVVVLVEKQRTTKLTKK